MDIGTNPELIRK